MAFDNEAYTVAKQAIEEQIKNREEHIKSLREEILRLESALKKIAAAQGDSSVNTKKKSRERLGHGEPRRFVREALTAKNGLTPAGIKDKIRELRQAEITDSTLRSILKKMRDEDKVKKDSDGKYSLVTTSSEPRPIQE